MNDDIFQQQLISRLDIIIRLLLANSGEGKQRSISDMAADLDGMGLAPAEIGAILGKASNYVSATLKSKKRTNLRSK